MAALPTASVPTAPPAHIFILSGQSNMAGRGGTDDRHRTWDAVVPLDAAPDPAKIHRLNASLQWEPARDPLHHDIDAYKTNGVGPGMPFANAIKGHVGDGAVVRLVPCAVGGTKISQWGRGEELYENMVKRARHAKEEGTGEIKALLWFQGESDTNLQADVDGYKGRLEALIHNVREDLGMPNLPIILVVITSAEGKYLEEIRAIQKGINNIPNVVLVDAKTLDVQLKEDNLHLNTDSQVKVGKALADAYLKNFATPAAA